MNRIRYIFQVAGLSIIPVCFAGTSSAQEMTRFETVSECAQAIQRAAIYRDQLDAERYSNLFVEEGVIVISGNATTGKEAIAERVRAADRSEIDRHFTGSIVVDVDDSGSITAKSYVVIYEGKTPESPGRVPVEEFLMSEYDDQMRMTDNGCKFIRREVTTIFPGGG